MSNTPKALIYQSELDFISKCVLDYPDLETGGDFFGFWTRQGYPVVQFVIGPGKNTTRTATSFYQDIDYLKKCGNLLNGKYGLEHIGGWHSHHRLSLAHPSGGDVGTMRNFFRDTNHFNFLISISNIERDSQVKINGFLFSRDNPNDYSTCDWKVYDGLSPVRENILRTDADLFIMPETKKASVSVGNDIEQSHNQKTEKVEKPDLPSDSYWSTPEGAKYLKKTFEQLKTRKDLDNIDLKQLSDKRIAISFKHKGGTYEIRFPNDFPKNAPEVIEKMPVDNDGIIAESIKKMFRPSKNRAVIVQKFIHSLDILDKDSVITITYL